MMRQFDIVFPEYGFAKHKGYGTKQQIEAIQKSKATPIHRKSFNPVSHHLPNMAYLQRNRLLGELGEQLTACQLIRNQQNILEMNYNVPKIGEIDIISFHMNELVFTDVKTFMASYICFHISKHQFIHMETDNINLSNFGYVIIHFKNILLVTD
jgi:hypothetical protein